MKTLFQFLLSLYFLITFLKPLYSHKNQYDFKPCVVPDSLNLSEVWVRNCILTEELKRFLVIKKNFSVNLHNVINETMDLKHSFINKISFNRTFKDVKTLDVSDNNLENVDNVFEYLINLKSFELGFNKIKELPEIINLIHLTTFHLNNNNISYFGEKVFSKLENLRSFWLDIFDFSSKFLQSLKRLNDLILKVRKVLNLTGEVFKNNKSLKQLRIYGGKCIFFNDSLNLLVNLETFVVSYSEINKLPFLYSNIGLKTLSLVACKIKSLPSDFFLQLKLLENLDLSFNELNDWSFASYSLEKLQFLDLTGNKIKKLTPSNFNLPSLIQLNLSKNNIFEITPESNFNTSKLRRLSLKKNNLTTISGLNGLFELETIDLSYNKFSEYPDLSYYFSLNFIFLNNNNLQELWLKDIGIPNNAVISIDVSNNQLKQINVGMIKKKLIKNNSILKLKITGNPLKCDCTLYNVKDGDNLYFEFKKNEFCNGNIDYKILKCNYLAVKKIPIKITFPLNYFKCLEKCNCWIFPSNSTLLMNCSNLNITSLPKITNFEPFRVNDNSYNNLYVDLSRNLIKELVRVDGFQNVTGLSLSKNSLEVIKWLPTKLKILELDNNNLEYLDYKTLSSLKKLNLSKLSLNKNPWLCNCNAVNLTKFLQFDLRSILTNNTILCQDERLLLDLLKKDLCPPNHLFTISLIVIILSLVIILFITYKKCKLKIKTYYYMKRHPQPQCIYDAFLCYSYKNEDYIEKLVRKLENEHNLKLCIHARDWIPGELISKQIQSSIENSRKTLLVVSDEFLKSDWGKTEIITAYEHFKTNRQHLIVIILLDRDRIDNIEDDDWRFYLKKAACVLKHDEKYFWKKLQRYLI